MLAVKLRGQRVAGIGMSEIADHHWWPLPVLEDR